MLDPGILSALGLLARPEREESEGEALLTRAKNRMEELRNGAWRRHVPLARIHAIRGEPDAAVRLLDQAIEAGWREYYMERGHGYSIPSGDPRYERLVAGVETEIARMRDRVLQEHP